MSSFRAELIHAADGWVSLELGPMRMEQLSPIIESEFGCGALRRRLFKSDIEILGEKIFVVREYGELYLMSRDPNGIEILKKLCHAISAV